MAAPWEKYGAAPAAAGPWAKYGAQPAAPARPMIPTSGGPGDSIVAIPDARLETPEGMLTPRPKDTGPSLMKMAGGLLDNVLPAISSIPAEIVASGSRLMGAQPETVERNRNFFQMQPFSQTGKDVQNEIMGGVQNAVSPWLDAGGNALEAIGGEKLRTDAGIVLQGVADAANVAPVLGGLARVASTPRAPKPYAPGVTPQAMTPEEIANAAGMKIPASHIEARGAKAPLGARVREGFGAHEEHRASIINNRQQANNLVSQDLGIPPGTQLDDAAFADAKKPHLVAYGEMRKLPAAPTDAEFRSGILRSGNNNVALPPDSEVAKLKAYLVSKETFDGNELVDTISRLRERALADSKSTSGGDALDMADAQMALADTLEDYMQRRADAVDTSLGQRYKASRRGLAKVHATEMAMDGFMVDPQKLSRYNTKHPGRLDGNLRVVADLASHYPDAVTSRVPLAKDTDTVAGMIKAPMRGLARKMLGGNPEPNPAALQRFTRDTPPITGGPVDPFASDLALAPEPPPPAPPIPGQISFADVLSETPPDFPVRPGRPGVPPVPVPTAAEMVPPVQSLPGSPLQAARQQGLAEQLAGDLSLAPEPAASGYVPSAADLVDWERPMDIGTVVPGIDGAPRLAGDLQLEGGPSIEELIRFISDQDTMPTPRGNSSFADQLGQTRDPIQVPQDRRQSFEALSEPTSGVGLPDQAGPPQDFSALLAELGIAPDAPQARFEGDYVPARGMSDLTRWLDDEPPAAAAAVPEPRPRGGAPGSAREENLKKWFGNSKVTTPDGKPMTLYHGTTGDFDAFKPGGNNEHMSGRAIWMTDDPSRINAAHNIGGFGGTFKDGTNVMPLHAKIENPLRVGPENVDAVRQQYGKNIPEIITREQAYDLMDSGFDGLIYEKPGNPNEYVVFDSTQVKSSIGNSGEFDPSNPSVVDMVRGKEPSSLADLALAPDAPVSPRVRRDVTEEGPSQGTERFPDRYKRPEAIRVETDDGYISYIDKGDEWQIDDAFVKEGARGKGLGQAQLLDLAEEARRMDKNLNSDVKVTEAQRRVYETAKAKGTLTFDGPFDDGGPVFRNIRPVDGFSGLVD